MKDVKHKEDCKPNCTEDPRCKAYNTKAITTEGFQGYECHVSTDTDCPRGASWTGPFNEDNIGDFRKKVECVDDLNTSVCHIKQSGKSMPI